MQKSVYLTTNERGNSLALLDCMIRPRKSKARFSDNASAAKYPSRKNDTMMKEWQRHGGIPSSKQRTHYYFRKIFHEKHLKRLAISLHCVYRSSSDKVPMNGGCELLIQTLKTGDLLGKKYLAFGKLFVSHKTYEIRTVFSNLDRIFQIWAKTFGKIITASFKSFGLSRDTLG